MNIAVATIIDGAKSGWHLAKALSTYTPHHVSYVCHKDSPSAYGRALAAADVIIVAGDSLINIRNNVFKIFKQRSRTIYEPGSGHRVKKGVITISMPLGRGYRRKGLYRHAHEIWPLDYYRRSFHMITPAEPDLNYPEINDGVMPYTIDTASIKPAYKLPAELTIGAYMGGGDSKHVKQYLLPAIEHIRGEGISAKLIISGEKAHVGHVEFMRRFQQYTLYYGQITTIGVHGRSEVEALASGVPTIVSITDEARAQAGVNDEYGAPFLKAYSVSDVADILRAAAHKELDLMAISKASRAYAEKWHSYKSVAQQALKIIEEASSRAFKRDDSYASAAATTPAPRNKGKRTHMLEQRKAKLHRPLANKTSKPKNTGWRFRP